MRSLPRRADQRHRVNRVVNFAYAHLDDALDLEALADVACLSKFHFSRVFSAHLRESPLQFLWRIRIERAARNLLYLPDEPITEVALDAGFSSPQTFSQVFRKRYRIAPRSFRAAFLAPPPEGSQDCEPKAGLRWPTVQAPESDEAGMLVQIEAKPAYRVAYLRHIGPYSGRDCRVTATHHALEAWARSRDLWRDDTVVIGLCPDHSAFTPPALCLYDACLPVPEGFREDEVVSIQTIPGGLYAVLKVSCPAPRMDNVWEWLTSVWLPASGRTREVLPCYEYYPPAAGRPVGPENGVELCLRLKAPQ